MPTILIAYATRYGTTQEAAGILADALRQHGFTVEVQPARQVRSLAGFSAVVLGAPLHMYRWHPHAFGFLNRFRKALAGLPLGIFALGPVQNPRSEQEWTDARVQMDKELAKVAWLKPAAIEMFGGKFDPTKIGFPLSLFAGKVPPSDARDPAALAAWAEKLAGLLSSITQP